MNWTTELERQLKDLVAKNHDTLYLAAVFNTSEAAIRGKLQRMGLRGNLKSRAARADAREAAYAAGDTHPMDTGETPAEVLLKSPISPNAETPEITKAKSTPIQFGRIPVEVYDGDSWTRFGMVSDTHLGCRECRLDALHAQYEIFQREGIRTVFHAGNIVDGYVPRINGDSAIPSIDGQVQCVIDNYPKVPGLVTHFITGDDHEGWWQKEGFNFGAYLQLMAEAQGRTDLKYIGHVEGDVELRAGEHSQILKVQHPGGGSAYARSYKGQKMVESFQGGEKPAILMQGHYHVSGYSFDRNVHIIGMPGFQDQTVFGRKKHLRFEIGGVLCEFKMSRATGAITRFRTEFNMFFDRGFYKPFLQSDRVVRKNHLVLETGQ